MARARAAEQQRSRSKTTSLEEITLGIAKFQEVVATIHDISREGFPYRDAAQSKAELQFRECLRQAFGERSPEFQTHRNFKIRTGDKADVIRSLSVITGLIATLEDRKLELQGLKPPKPEPQPEATLTNTARVAPVHAPFPAGTPVPTPTLTPMPTAPVDYPISAPMPAPQSTPAASPIVHPIRSVPDVLVESSSAQSTAVPVPAASAMPTPVNLNGPTAVVSSPPPHMEPSQPTISAPPDPSSEKPSSGSLPSQSSEPVIDQDPLQLVRKVCLRLHSVARQLRLRRDYRPTLEIEDDHDLQDLLCALLKVEFDEVATEEWTPPYTGGTPRTMLLINRDQIAVVAKKTRSGLSAKELADQVTADSAYYRAQGRGSTLFCFMYDPEGRIGSPKRLETTLTSVSEHCRVEVLVAPK